MRDAGLPIILCIILSIILSLILSISSVIGRIIHRIRYRIIDRHKMTLCYFLPINPPVISTITLPVIAPNLQHNGQNGEIMGRIIVLLTCTP